MAAPPIPQTRFQVPPLRNLALDEVNRWIGHLNRSFAQVADQLGRAPAAKGVLTKDLDAGGNQLTNVGFPTDPDHVVTVESLPQLVDSILDQGGVSATSENDSPPSGTRSTRRTAHRRLKAIEDAIAQVLNAVPTVAPPEVADASALGTTTDPVVFALSDHTHAGVNLDQPQSITGLKTFNRAPNPPFAVQAGSTTVVNLGASFARRAVLAFPLQAGIAPAPSNPALDLGYRRTMLLMGAH